MAGFSITIAGDSALNLEFAHAISPETSAMIRLAAENLTADPIEGITELVPTFCSLMVYYNPLAVTFDELSARLRGKLRDVGEADLSVRKIVQIPVCYGGEYGPDLANVAAHAGLTPQEVVNIHTAHDYLIDMLGFLPGFAYLGGLDERLHTPRLATPRTRIEPGSVGIGARRRASTRWPRPAAGRSSAARRCALTTRTAPSPFCTRPASTCVSCPSQPTSTPP